MFIDILDFLFMYFILGYWLVDVCFWNSWKIGWAKLVFGLICIFLPNICPFSDSIIFRMVILFIGLSYIQSLYFSKIKTQNL